MKKNTLTLLSTVSLTVMLAACGGGGSSEDTRAVPAAWDGTWAVTDECTSSQARTDTSGIYYESSGVFIINSAAKTSVVKEFYYTDAKCTQKAGALEITFDISQLAKASFSGYESARTGVITVTNVKIGPDGDGSGLTLNPEPIYKGVQTNQSLGINASGQLCGSSSNGTPNMAEAVCSDRKK